MFAYLGIMQIVCSISEIAKECDIKLSVYQHGAVAALKGLPQFHAENIYLQYGISQNTFNLFYKCGGYICASLLTLNALYMVLSWLMD